MLTAFYALRSAELASLPVSSEGASDELLLEAIPSKRLFSANAAFADTLARSDDIHGMLSARILISAMEMDEPSLTDTNLA